MQTRWSFARLPARRRPPRVYLVSLSEGAGSARADNPILTGDLFEDSFVDTLRTLPCAK